MTLERCWDFLQNLEKGIKLPRAPSAPQTCWSKLSSTGRGNQVTSLSIFLPNSHIISAPYGREFLTPGSSGLAIPRHLWMSFWILPGISLSFFKHRHQPTGPPLEGQSHLSAPTCSPELHRSFLSHCSTKISLSHDGTRQPLQLPLWHCAPQTGSPALEDRTWILCSQLHCDTLHCHKWGDLLHWCFLIRSYPTSANYFFTTKQCEGISPDSGTQIISAVTLLLHVLSAHDTQHLPEWRPESNINHSQ